MDIKTTQKFVVESPKKLREVVVALASSKLTPSQALERLELVGKRAAFTIKKAINVAMANAKQANLNPEELIFKEIQINEGPVLKRFRAGSRGRAKPYKKRLSHIRVVLTTRNDQISKLQSKSEAVEKKDKHVVETTKVSKKKK